MSGWTIDTLSGLQSALREADARFYEERDRRLTEVGVEREKALKIKETADLAALGLAREIQTYKDEKANQLREQISSERGLYATKNDLSAAADKIDATIKPLLEFVSGSRGHSTGATDSRQLLTWGLGILVALMGLYAFTKPLSTLPPAAAPQVIYVPAPSGTQLPVTPPASVPR